MGEDLDELDEQEKTLRRLNEEKLAEDIAAINRKKAQTLLNIEKWYQGERAKLGTTDEAVARSRADAELARIEADYQNKRAILVKQQQETATLDDQHVDLRKAVENKYTYDLEQILLKRAQRMLDLEKTRQKAELAERQRLAAQNEEELKKIKDQERQIDIDHARKTLDLVQANLALIMDSEFANADQRIAAKKEVYDAEAKLSDLRTKDYIADREEETAQDIKELKARLKYVKEYGDEYWEIMKRLRDLDASTDAEFDEAMARREAKQEGLWASFGYGVKQARGQLKDWGDVMIDIGSTIEDTIAGGMTDAILDFSEGTKTAKEAFSDFARSTVRWLAEIILKTTILNTLRGYTGSGGGGYGTSTYTGGEMGYTYHRGGRVGQGGGRRMVDPAMFQFAPRLHSGLRADEFPAILQRGEEVIPKTKAGQPFGDVKVVVNNNSGQQVTASPQGVKFDGSNMIVSVVIDAYNRNKMGFRDMMRSPA
jgi:hypothetical protein